VIVGDGPLRSELAASAERLAIAPHVRLLGDRAEVVDVLAAFDDQWNKMAALKAQRDGVIVAAMVKGQRELAIGAKLDAQFGPVVLVGDGGKYIEALKDYALLRHPFAPSDAIEALQGLRIAPLFAGVRGEPAIDLHGLAETAQRLGTLMHAARDSVSSIDLNPVMAIAGANQQTQFVIADALIERQLGQGARGH